MHSTGSCLSRCLASKKSFSTATFGCVVSLGTPDRVDLFRKVSCVYPECIYSTLPLHLLHKLLMYYSCYHEILVRGKFMSTLVLIIKS